MLLTPKFKSADVASAAQKKFRHKTLTIKYLASGRCQWSASLMVERRGAARRGSRPFGGSIRDRIGESKCLPGHHLRQFFSNHRIRLPLFLEIQRCNPDFGRERRMNFYSSWLAQDWHEAKLEQAASESLFHGKAELSGAVAVAVNSCHSLLNTVV